MTYCITLRRGASKLSELVPNPFDLFNKNNVQNNTKSYKFAMMKLQLIFIDNTYANPYLYMFIHYTSLILLYRGIPDYSYKKGTIKFIRTQRQVNNDAAEVSFLIHLNVVSQHYLTQKIDNIRVLSYEIQKIQF